MTRISKPKKIRAKVLRRARYNLTPLRDGPFAHKRAHLARNLDSLTLRFRVGEFLGYYNSVGLWVEISESDL